MADLCEKRDWFQRFTRNDTFSPASIYLLKVNNKNTTTQSEIRSKLTIKTQERIQNGYFRKACWPVKDQSSVLTILIFPMFQSPVQCK